MSSSFQPYDPYGAYSRTRRNLPHWHQPGATYFVTFRLADALPAEVCARLLELRNDGLGRTADMAATTETPSATNRIGAGVLAPTGARPPRSPDDEFAWVEPYLDAGTGSCRLAAVEEGAIVEGALRYGDGVRYWLGAYCVMPNHVHALVQPIAPNPLSSITQAWKSFTAHVLKRTCPTPGRVWQPESYDRIVRNETELRHFETYILENPVAAKLPDGTFRVGRGSARWL